jgi:hypothetical protein
MDGVPQTGHCVHSYLGWPREHPHDRASPDFSELMRGVTSFPQSHRHSAAL